MRHVLAIALREIRSLFATPLGWVLLGMHMIFTGYIFFISLRDFVVYVERVQAMGMLEALEFLNLNDRVILPAFVFYQVVLIILVPILTMRAFAEERANGTIELLLTSPVTSTELVLGKYLGALAGVALLVAISALYPGLLFLYGDPELLQTFASVLGLFLVGAALAALGCFCSTLTRSPAAAAIIAIFAGLMLWLASLAADAVPPGPFAEFVRYVAIGEHFLELARGLVRTRDLVYYAVFIVFFLVLARTGVEAMRVR